MTLLSAASGTTALDWTTAIATSAAALIAAVAVAVSWASLKKEHEQQRLRERHRLAVDLLAAFESVAVKLPRPHEKPLDRSDSQWREAIARYVALLRASEERLPINRGMQRHIPYGATDEEAEHLKAARIDGDPETEDHALMAQRAEIVDVIESLRSRMSE